MNIRELSKDLVSEEMVAQSPGFCGVLSLDSKFLLVNKTGAAWTGFKSPDAMIGYSYADVHCSAADDYNLFLEHDEIVKQRGSIRFIGYYEYADYNWKIIMGRKYIVKNENNAVIISEFDDYTNCIDISRYLTQLNINDKGKLHKKRFCYLLDEIYPKFQLTNQEKWCLFWFMRSKHCKEIAYKLDIKECTVREHLKNIKKKLNCFSTKQLFSKAFADGYMNVLPFGSPSQNAK